ncbi:inositol monophosphatase [Corynebacteriales bacterium D3-21]|uniref:Inositol-1-monophosphatase n=1 Tax=Speluncibacter jeojiensis TaxID=2710754 RepID=A0A9X4RFF5_9ACTN|nr:inositol monophosphatase [Corynebacteriales bacterium D3-21]
MAGVENPIELRRVATQVAQVAAARIRRRRPEVFGAGGGAVEGAVQTKSTPTDPVTVLDTESEVLIREQLAELRPGDRILGEEGGGTAGDVAGLRWVVDPIDGTVNFLYGIPAYAVSVAVQLDGVSVAGAVVDVVREITYSAALGQGASVVERDGASRALRCNEIDSAAVALLATGFGYDERRRAAQGRLIGELLGRVRDIRRIGSAALDLCMVASGQVDAHFEHGLSPWDWAAGSLIAAEAGAVVRLPAPDSVSADGAVTIAMAPGIADELGAIFTEIGAFRPLP